MKTCGVRAYKAVCERCGSEPLKRHVGCDFCLVGCFNPARHRNPFFGTDFWSDAYWWRGMYSHVEYLCAECYDRMVEDCKETETAYRDGDPNYVEDPEFTRLLETL